MADAYSISTGVAPQGVSINDSRRVFNFGDRVSELAPQQSPFFVYLSKVAKESTKLKESIREQLQVKLDADIIYETRWVIYHTILGIELFVVIVLLFLIWWKL